jgi:hypothetical protein
MDNSPSSSGERAWNSDDQNAHNIENGQLKTYIAIVPLNPKHSFNETFEEIPKIILSVDFACLGYLQAAFEHLNKCLVIM